MRLFDGNESGGKVSFRIQQSVVGLFINVIADFSAGWAHNAMYAKPTIDIFIVSRNSLEREVCSNMPLVRLFSKGQWRKGYWCMQDDRTLVGEGVTPKYGPKGFVLIGNGGNIQLDASQYIEVTIKDMPTGAQVFVDGIEDYISTNQYLKYERIALPKGQYEGMFQTGNRYDSAILPIGTTVEYAYEESPNSVTNPLDFVMLDFKANQPNIKLDRFSIGYRNVLENNSDVAMITTSVNIYGFGTRPINVNSNKEVGMSCGVAEYGIIDLQDVESLKVVKKTSDEYQMVFVKNETI